MSRYVHVYVHVRHVPVHVDVLRKTVVKITVMYVELHGLRLLVL